MSSTVRSALAGLALTGLLASAAVPDELVLGSFAIDALATGRTPDQVELGLIADRLQQFDLVAVQYLRNAALLDQLRQVLASRGLEYRSLVGEPAGQGRRKTCLAFLWLAGQVEAMGPGRLYQEGRFLRPPFCAGFRAGRFDFTLVDVHLISGFHVEDQRAEAVQLSQVAETLAAADPGEQDVILLGSFNLPPEDEGFADLCRHLTPLFTGPLWTTIADRELADNIWLDLRFTREFAGAFDVDRFDEAVFEDDDAVAKLVVSGHRPIWARFRTDGPDDDGPAATGAGPDR